MMKKELGPMAKLHGGPDNKAIGGLNSAGPEAISAISKNIPDLMKDVNAIKSRFENFEQDKRSYHTYGNPETLTKAKDGKVINTKNVDEGEFSKVKTMPPLKPIVTGPKGDQYYVNDGPQATRPPRGTKEERDTDKFIKKGNKAVSKRDNKVRRLENKVRKNTFSLNGSY